MGLDITLYRVSKKGELGTRFLPLKGYKYLLPKFGNRVQSNQITDESRLAHLTAKYACQSVGLTLRNYDLIWDYWVANQGTKFDIAPDEYPNYFEYQGMQIPITDEISGRAYNDCGTVTIRGLWLYRIGYQRRGANDQFYKDKMWNCEFHFRKSDVKAHYRDYFAESDFKKNILDKFIPGETILIYH